MATDIFGDSTLFEEFDRDRAHNLFATTNCISLSNNDKCNSDVSSDSGSSATEISMPEVRQNCSPSIKSSQHPDITTTDTQMVIDNRESNNIKSLNSKILLPSTHIKDSHEQTSYDLLKSYTRLIDTTRYVTLRSESPCIQVIYQNNKFARKYRADIESFLTSLIAKEFADTANEKLPELKFQVGHKTGADLCSSRDDTQLRRLHAYIGCSHLYRDFVVDTNGWQIIDDNAAQTHGRLFVQYEQLFSGFLPCDETHDDKATSQPKRQKTSCFNCDGDHVLSKCTLPHDIKRIREKSRLFREMVNSPKLGLSSNRAPTDKRFDNFKPGIYSPELRKALGISDLQLPPFIYSMRLLGYPPGWKNEAEKQLSGLSLFDKHGNEVNMKEDLEPPPTQTDQSLVQSLDVSKIIEYPGFTTEGPPNYIEECHLYDRPPLQSHQLKSTVVHYVTKQEDERKRRVQQQKEMENKRRKLETEADMEIDHDHEDGSEFIMPDPPLPDSLCNPPMPIGTPPSSPPTPSIPSQQIDESMSLTDLETMYNDICNAIDNVDSVQTPPQAPCSPTLDQTPDKSSVQHRSINALRNMSRSMEQMSGTPVSQSVIPCLPDPESFSQGVEDHIPFENLPDATGRYEKLREMLRSIRK